MKTIFVTEMDYQRLQSLVQMHRSASGVQAVAFLSSQLKQATVLPSSEIPDNVVTMNSLVRLKELKSEVELELSIVYPKDAELPKKKISVLAPVGAAVLGSKVGEVVEWTGPGGVVSYKVEEVLYQPEAAGNIYL